MPRYPTVWLRDSDRKKFDEIMRSRNPLSKELIAIYDSICKTPFEGKGRPHRLHGNRKKWWSRHISGPNVIVYNIDKNDNLVIKELNVNYHKSSGIDFLLQEAGQACLVV
jgi:Txe/YoeB family toxin of Txe-Axe toxin-antitoxin module